MGLIDVDLSKSGIADKIIRSVSAANEQRSRIKIGSVHDYTLNGRNGNKMTYHAVTERWYPLIAAPTQVNLWHSTARFNIATAGRRSGKTERAKRKLVNKALNFHIFPDGLFVASAPTRDQAKRIYWKDLKRLVPRWAWLHPDRKDKSISETELTIRLFNGAEIVVVGMDKPHRIEGVPVDFIILDEYADMKPETWEQSVRPALATLGRPGEAWFIGKPRGRNHYWKLKIKTEERNRNGNFSWRFFHWTSADVLPPSEIEALKDDLDPVTYLQEVEANFVNFEGRAYYSFDREIHAQEKLPYDDELPLIICFDFNVKPGTAVVCQEHYYKGRNEKCATYVTCVIGEVHIENNSNTPLVCNRLLTTWSNHKGNVYAYGDATGGARGTAKVAGSDWAIITDMFRQVFGSRFKLRVPSSNPSERERVNAVNARLLSTKGVIRMLVDREAAPHTMEDLEGVVLKSDGSGEIDKKDNPALTHLTDALGYYIYKEFPIFRKGKIRMLAE